MTPEEEAQKAWKEKSGIMYYNNTSLAYLDGIDDFKASLKAAVEDLMSNPDFVVKNPTDYDYRLVEDARKEVNMYKEFLKLISNCRPKD